MLSSRVKIFTRFRDAVSLEESIEQQFTGGRAAGALVVAVGVPYSNLLDDADEKLINVDVENDGRLHELTVVRFGDSLGL